jgi:hypothetical protein
VCHIWSLCVFQSVYSVCEFRGCHISQVFGHVEGANPALYDIMSELGLTMPSFVCQDFKVNACNFNVPQSRRRVLMLGVRADVLYRFFDGIPGGDMMHKLPLALFPGPRGVRGGGILVANTMGNQYSFTGLSLVARLVWLVWGSQCKPLQSPGGSARGCVIAWPMAEGVDRDIG